MPVPSVASRSRYFLRRFVPASAGQGSVGRRALEDADVGRALPAVAALGTGRQAHPPRAAGTRAQTQTTAAAAATRPAPRPRRGRR